MITIFFTNLLSSPNLYYNSHYEKFADGTVKCIDDEIPFEIPQSWCWVRLLGVGKTETGTTPSKTHPEYFGDYMPFIGPGNIQGNKIVSYTQGISEIGVDYCRPVPQNTILQVCIGGSIGKAAITTEWSAFNQQINSIEPYRCVYYKYIFYTLLTDYFKKAMIERSTGTATPIINRSNWEGIILPIPPQLEQQRVVARIEELMPIADKYEKSQEALDKLNAEIFDKLKKSVLQEAIQGKLVPQDPNDEPASVLLERIKEEKAKLFKEGKLRKKDLVDSVIFKGDDNKYYEKLGGKTTEITEEIPYELPNNWVFVRLANLCWLDDGYKASGEKLPYMDAKYHRGKSEITYLTQGKIVEPPCKAILVDGENSGEIFNITEKGYLGSTFKVLQISKCISEDWLHILLNTYRNLFKNNKVGAAIPHLNKNLFRNLIVGLPPIEEQQRITDRVEKLMKGIEGI